LLVRGATFLVMIISQREPSVDALEVLTQFGASALRAGNTAVRTRELMEAVALKLGFEAIAVNLSLDGITANARHSGKWISTMRMLGPPGINVSRIGRLEQLAQAVGPGTAPNEIAAKLKSRLCIRERRLRLPSAWRAAASRSLMESGCSR